MFRGAKDLQQHRAGILKPAPSSGMQLPPTTSAQTPPPPIVKVQTVTNNNKTTTSQFPVMPPSQRRRSSGSDLLTRDLDDGADEDTDDKATANSFLPPSQRANANQLDELQKQLQKQRMDLEQRTDNVNAIQRNFQRLSEMYSSDRQKLVAAEQEIDRLNEELAQLRTEKKLFAAVRVEFTALQESNKHLQESRESEAALALSQRKELEEKLRSLERENHTVNRALAKMTRDLQSAQEDEALQEHALRNTVTGWNRLIEFVEQWQSAARQQQQQQQQAQQPLERGGGTNRSTTSTTGAPPIVCGAGIAKISISASSSAAQSNNNRGGSTSAAAASGSSTVVGESFAMRLEVVAESIGRCFHDALPPLRRHADDAAQREGPLRDALRESTAELDGQRQRNESLQRECSTLQSELDAAKRKITALVEQHQLEKADFEKKWQAIRDGMANSNQAALGEAQTALAQLQTAHEVLQQRCSRSEAALDATTAEKTALQHDLDAAVRKVQQLEELVSKATTDQYQQMAERDKASRAAAAKIASLETTVDSLRAEQQRLRSQLTGALSAESDAQRERNAAAEELNAAKTQMIQDLQAKCKVVLSENATLQERLQEVMLQLEQRTQERDERTTRITKMETELGDAATQRKKLDGMVADLQGERAQLQLEIARLEEEIRSSKEASKQLKDQLAQARAQASRVAALEAETSRLRDELTAAGTANRDSDALKAKLKTQQEEISELKTAVLNGHSMSQIHAEKIQSLSKSLAIAEKDAAEAKRMAESVLSTQAAFDSQRRLLDEQRLAAEARAKSLRSVQEETLRTVKKLLNIDKACESGVSCQTCLQLLKDPVVCAPCGHVYCDACLRNDTNNKQGKGPRAQPTYCPECDEHSIAMIAPAKGLELLTGKMQHREQVLGDLSKLLEKELLFPS